MTMNDSFMHAVIGVNIFHHCLDMGARPNWADALQLMLRAQLNPGVELPYYFGPRLEKSAAQALQ